MLKRILVGIVPREQTSIKLHILLDVNTSSPVLVVVTDAKSHDVNGLELITYEASSFYVVDRY